jgi:hypothetical protein
VRLTLTATDDVSVTLVVLQDGAQNVAMQITPTLTVTWTPATAGSHVFQALAFDAGANAATATLTVTAGVLAEPRLWLPDPPVLPLDAPLLLTFSRPITGDTVKLQFSPVVSYTILSNNGAKALVLHAPFQPATRYYLTLEGGFGPDSILPVTHWTFTSAPWRTYAPLIPK